MLRASSRTSTTAGTLEGAMTEVLAAQGLLRGALPPGWRAHPPTYDPDAQQWSIWAVPRPPIAVHPVRGSGPTEAAAVVDLAARLRVRFG